MESLLASGCTERATLLATSWRQSVEENCENNELCDSGEGSGKLGLDEGIRALSDFRD